ncbi:FAD-dependent oxidoreductase [Phytoactinopolyspora mesophila]|uniref:FAD-dependent oxidoreductase n=1 Tax=Phytoactinopolyspora mesophila TaxID=2650750 RepID=A0A7K3M4P0_9ACTN|nr:FAD-dependent oxidoreductase [Phytoactinopolyspora mesophila]
MSPSSIVSPGSASVPERATVVIVGGGVMGASIAFHLAEAGVKDVVLLERSELGSGSSGKPIGGVRAQFSDPLNIELGARSLRAFQDFPRRPGRDIKLDNVGYLFLLTTDDHVSAFEDSVAIQNRLGVPSRLMSPDEAHQLCPYVTTEGLLAAVFSPDDGHARPTLVIEGYAQAAAREGVCIMPQTSVVGMDTHGDDITAVHTSRGTIRCSTVICAAGAWSARIGEMAGVDLPVRPFRRQIAFTVPLRPAAPRIPFTIDFDSSGYFHNSDDGLLFGLADPRENSGFDTGWTPGWMELFRQAMRRRAPELADMAIANGWAGLYEVTPDHNALIGRASSPENFLYATGFSGHGFLQAPAVGEIVRDLYLDRTPPVDVTPLSGERFAAGATTRPESHVV